MNSQSCRINPPDIGSRLFNMWVLDIQGIFCTCFRANVNTGSFITLRWTATIPRHSDQHEFKSLQRALSDMGNRHHKYMDECRSRSRRTLDPQLINQATRNGKPLDADEIQSLSNIARKHACNYSS